MLGGFSTGFAHDVSQPRSTPTCGCAPASLPGGGYGSPVPQLSATDRRLIVAGTAALVVLHLAVSARVGAPAVVFDVNGYLGSARWLAGNGRWQMPVSPSYAPAYPAVLAPMFAVIGSAGGNGWRCGWSTPCCSPRCFRCWCRHRNRPSPPPAAGRRPCRGAADGRPPPVHRRGCGWLGRAGVGRAAASPC